jgi:acetyl-CoA carboxylase carboxyltransferase component
MERKKQKRINELRRVKRICISGGGKEEIARQHRAGKLTARERISSLLDPGTFIEWNLLVGHKISAPADGVIAGHGAIDGRTVCIYAHDRTVRDGSVGALGGYKMYITIERALQMGVPLIGLYDSPGVRALRLESSMRIDEPGGVDMVKYPEGKSAGSVFSPLTDASGIIPQVGAVLGSCAGMGVYSCALHDFIFMVDAISHMFITGPRLVKSLMGEDVTKEELGGAKVHAQISGIADFRLETEEECFKKMRKLLSFLPANYREDPPWKNTDDNPNRQDNLLTQLVPDDPDRPYDMHQIISGITDNGDFFETKAEFAPEIIVGFARLDGHSLGIIANQPLIQSGKLTADSADKQARFIRFCDAFNIPLVVLVDTPAYTPGREQEHSGTIRSSAKVLYALCEATNPRVAVVIRRSYGGAGNLCMGVNPGLGTDFVFAWPTAETSMMKAEQLVDLFYSSEADKSKNSHKLREQKIEEYRNWYADILSQASIRTHITDVIEPRDTRRQLIKSLQFLRSKKVIRQPKKHGNIPL